MHITDRIKNSFVKIFVFVICFFLRYYILVIDLLLRVTDIHIIFLFKAKRKTNRIKIYEDFVQLYQQK